MDSQLLSGCKEVRTESDYKWKILIIDDDQVNLVLINSILSPEYMGYIAASSQEGLDIVRRKKPDLVLLDIMMPGVDGFEALKILKNSAETLHIPVIIITGLHSIEDEEKGLLFGAVDFIKKPFVNAVVRARVQSQIRILEQIRLIERIGLIDSLTQIPNRRYFDDRIDME